MASAGPSPSEDGHAASFTRTQIQAALSDSSSGRGASRRRKAAREKLEVAHPDMAKAVGKEKLQLQVSTSVEAAGRAGKASYCGSGFHSATGSPTLEASCQCGNHTIYCLYLYLYL